MTLDDMLTEVYALTNRPDLVVETKAAVKAATLKAHHSDYYSKDIHEVTVTLGVEESAYVYSLDIYNRVSNYRALKYIRKLDVGTAEPAEFIEVVELEELFDSYGVSRTDVCYMAGRNIEIKSSTLFNKIVLACYVSPLVTESAYASWVADLYPYVIVYEAARVVFKTIGYDEQSATYERLVAEQFALLTISALTDVGY